MRLSDYLDKLAWSQTDLARNAGISVATVRRVMSETAISRRNAQAICATLSSALRMDVEPSDINELHIQGLHRPRREKHRLTQLLTRKQKDG